MNNPSYQSSMITLNQRMPINQIEMMVSQIEVESDLFLDLPISEKYPPIQEAVFLQFILKWFRVSNGNLILNFPSTSSLDKLLNSFSENSILISVLLMAKDRKVFYRDKEAILKYSTNEIIGKIKALYDIFDDKKSYQINSLIYSKILSGDTELEEIRKLYKEIGVGMRVFEYGKIRNYFKESRNSWRPVSLFLSCFDHEMDLKYASCFYNEKKKIKEKRRFDYLIKQFLAEYNIGQDNQIEIISQSLKTVIYELIDNTDSWASKDINGKDYPVNLRGSVLKLYPNIDTIKFNEGDNGAIGNYFDQLDLKVLYSRESNQLDIFPEKSITENSNIGVIELSVIDSGPGLASRFLKMPTELIEYEKEQKASRDCFRLHFTSDKSGVSAFRGRGLPNVLMSIGNKGFIRVRSGRSEFYRNYYLDPIGDVHKEFDNPRFTFIDKKESLMTGTLISIFFPFVYAKQPSL